MKIQIISCVLIGLLLCATVLGGATSTVTCTVSAQQVAISVSDGEVNYDVVDLSSDWSTLVAEGNDQQTATNDGNVAEDFNIKSSDAVGTTTWVLSDSAIGSNQYMHKFSTTTGSRWEAMATSSYDTLASSVAATSSTVFDLQVLTPRFRRLSSQDDYGLCSGKR